MCVYLGNAILMFYVPSKMSIISNLFSITPKYQEKDPHCALVPAVGNIHGIMTLGELSAIGFRG